MMRAWASPLGLAALSIAGLVLALLCEGLVDWLALALIAFPLALLVGRLVRRQPSSRNES